MEASAETCYIGFTLKSGSASLLRCFILDIYIYGRQSESRGLHVWEKTTDFFFFSS